MLFRKGFVGILCAVTAFSSVMTACDDSNYTESSYDIQTTTAEENKIENYQQHQQQTMALPEVNTAPVSSYSGLFSDRDLSGEYDTSTAVTIALKGNTASINGEGAVSQENTITISDEGVYVLSGTLDDGQIIIDSQAKIQLVLDNAHINCSNSSPIYVKNADKVFVTLAENTDNSLSDGSEYLYSDEIQNEPDAVVFSHDSLTLNGSGNLVITANYNEGITSKDDIVITGGNISITSVGNGIKGKNYVALCNAQVNIDSQGDGVKSTNIEDEGLGFVYVESGALSITSAEDGIQSDTEIIIDDGEINITSGGGYSNAQPHMNNDFGGRGGFFGQEQSDNNTSAEDSVSTKCIKASSGVFINNGNFNLDSADDTLHSNSYINVSGGAFHMSAGGDGIHADAQIDICGGLVRISHSYEGIEASVINILDGEVDVASSDDGFNATDGTTQQGGMGRFSSSALLNIEGGCVKVNANGDGLDSNGFFTVSGGEIFVDGPTNSGNGVLDGNGEILANGGTLLAVGSSGMAEAPSNTSSQYSISVALESTYPNGSDIKIQTSDGEILTEHTSAKSFNHIVFSSEKLTQGETYSVLIDCENVASVTISDKTTFFGSQGNMMGGGFGGGGFDGGFGGGRGEMMEPPTNENGEFEFPDMPQGGFGGGFGGGRGEMMEPPTNENGEIEFPDMPQEGFRGQ
ncbi:MAG: carbohydrate-binding domain-containing protein [Ruminococcus sp.]|nr:carbohydrate-binding domain-containing protein [Ruminococcus sp.]